MAKSGGLRAPSGLRGFASTAAKKEKKKRRNFLYFPGEVEVGKPSTTQKKTKPKSKQKKPHHNKTKKRSQFGVENGNLGWKKGDWGWFLPGMSPRRGCP